MASFLERIYRPFMYCSLIVSMFYVLRDYGWNPALLLGTTACYCYWWGRNDELRDSMNEAAKREAVEIGSTAYSGSTVTVTCQGDTSERVAYRVYCQYCGRPFQFDAIGDRSGFIVGIVSVYCCACLRSQWIVPAQFERIRNETENAELRDQYD